MLHLYFNISANVRGCGTAQIEYVVVLIRPKEKKKHPELAKAFSISGLA